jgi:hypothetical protein
MAAFENLGAVGFSGNFRLAIIVSGIVGRRRFFWRRVPLRTRRCGRRVRSHNRFWSWGHIGRTRRAYGSNGRCWRAWNVYVRIRFRSRRRKVRVGCYSRNVRRFGHLSVRTTWCSRRLRCCRYINRRHDLPLSFARFALLDSFAYHSFQFPHSFGCVEYAGTNLLSVELAHGAKNF